MYTKNQSGIAKNELHSTSIENFRNYKKQRDLSHFNVADRQTFEEEVIENDFSWAAIAGYAVAILLMFVIACLFMFTSYLFKY